MWVDMAMEKSNREKSFWPPLLRLRRAGLTHPSVGRRSSPTPLYNQPLPLLQGSVASQPPTSHDQAGEEEENWARLSL